MLRTFKIPDRILDIDWQVVSGRLKKRLEETATRKTIKTKQGHTIQYDEMKASAAKDILDEIDVMLGTCYKLNAAEIDAIIGYDLIYRLGDSTADEE